MVVTDIMEAAGSRVLVYLDEEAAFMLYKADIRRYNIKKNAELEDSVYCEIVEQLLPKRAKLRCLNLLKAKDYTERQLRDKLLQARYPEQVVETALSYVKSYGYVNDLTYAQSYIEYRAAAKSRREITMQLSRKGISGEVIQSAWEEAKRLGLQSDEEPIIRDWMRKKHYDPERADQKETQKFYSFLYRKGFSAAAVSKVLRGGFDDFYTDI